MLFTTDMVKAYGHKTMEFVDYVIGFWQQMEGMNPRVCLSIINLATWTQGFKPTLGHLQGWGCFEGSGPSRPSLMKPTKCIHFLFFIFFDWCRPMGSRSDTNHSIAPLQTHLVQSYCSKSFSVSQLLQSSQPLSKDVGCSASQLQLASIYPQVDFKVLCKVLYSLNLQCD